MIRNLHLSVPAPDDVTETAVVTGDYDYCHYLYDGTDDRGWGCGYRTLQTIISWMILNRDNCRDKKIPSLEQIQQILVDIEDKPPEFVGSREWLGSVEVGLVVDQFCDVPCKIVHSRSGEELESVFGQVFQHLQQKKCPIMMGGDLDNSSKGIFGACKSEKDKYFLIIDPHFVKTKENSNITASDLIELRWVKWQKLKDFYQSSFYNLCLPQA